MNPLLAADAVAPTATAPPSSSRSVMETLVSVVAIALILPLGLVV